MRLRYVTNKTKQEDYFVSEENMCFTRASTESLFGSYGMSFDGISRMAGTGLVYAFTLYRIMSAILCAWKTEKGRGRGDKNETKT